jgi:hypothetical protein
MPATAGHDALLSYDWEDGFLNAPASADKKPFGRDAALTTEEAANNAVRLFEPGDNEAAQIIEQAFDGTWTAEFTLSNPWFLRAILGEASSSGTSPTTHTFNDKIGDPMRIFHGNENSSTYYALEGCVVQTATFTFNIPGTVDVSLEGAYATKNSDDPSFTQPVQNERALSYHDSRINRDTGSGGTDLSLVQSLTVTVNLNADMVDELGSRTAVDYSPKQRNTTIDYARIVQNSDDQERVYGNATTIQDKVENPADFIVEASNGKSGSDLNRVELQLDDVFPDTVSRTGIGDPEADLQDELSEAAPTITAVAENGTATAR